MTEPSCRSQLLASWCNVWSPVQPVNQYCPIELGLMMDVLSATLLNSWNMQVRLQGCIQWYMWLPATTLDIGDASIIEERSAGEHCSPGNQPWAITCHWFCFCSGKIGSWERENWEGVCVWAVGVLSAPGVLGTSRVHILGSGCLKCHGTGIFLQFPLVWFLWCWALSLVLHETTLALKGLSPRTGTVSAVRAYNTGSHRVLVLTSRLKVFNVCLQRSCLICIFLFHLDNDFIPEYSSTLFFLLNRVCFRNIPLESFFFKRFSLLGCLYYKKA